ncbi:MAG: hypothetical protein CBARDCOR_4201 [uncultured Caballeronia sp.]|nr:MAG: hypothetical protein CBARDCOR_4201 [uncultured Caballeronia sp.]
MEIVYRDESVNKGNYTWCIRGEARLDYEVIEAENIFAPPTTIFSEILDEIISSSRIRRNLIYADSEVFRLHGEALIDYFTFHNIRFKIALINVNESKKM